MKGGFTLVELLVAITIVVLLSGASLATYLNYRSRRQVQDDASSLADRLRTVQIKATAVEVPAGCGAVLNYAASLAGSGMTVGATCSGGGSIALPQLSLTLGNSIFANGPLSLTFSSRTVSASPMTIDVCGNNILYQVTVSETANVSRPVFVPGGC